MVSCRDHWNSSVQKGTLSNKKLVSCRDHWNSSIQKGWLSNKKLVSCRDHWNSSIQKGSQSNIFAIFCFWSEPTHVRIDTPVAAAPGVFEHLVKNMLCLILSKKTIDPWAEQGCLWVKMFSKKNPKIPTWSLSYPIRPQNYGQQHF